MTHVKLDIPFRSQWDQDARSHESDCGPTCVTMMLNGLGIEITPDEIYEHIGAKGFRQFSNFADLRNAALGGGGLTLTYQQYRNRTEAMAGLCQNLDAGRPFIALVKYEPWRERTGNQFSGGHFVLVVGYDEEHVYVHDPLFGLWAQREKGSYYRWSNWRFLEGWGGFPITENPNFASLIADRPFPFLAGGPLPEEELTPETEPEVVIGEDAVAMPMAMSAPTADFETEGPEPTAMDDRLRRRILSLAAYEGRPAPYLVEPATAAYWTSRVQHWGNQEADYTVQRGDTFYGIATKFFGDGDRWPAIQAYNDLTTTVLFVGQLLTIPLPEPADDTDALGPHTPAIEDPEIRVPPVTPDAAHPETAVPEADVTA